MDKTVEIVEYKGKIPTLTTLVHRFRGNLIARYAEKLGYKISDDDSFVVMKKWLDEADTSAARAYAYLESLTDVPRNPKANPTGGDDLVSSDWLEAVKPWLHCHLCITDNAKQLRIYMGHQQLGTDKKQLLIHFIKKTDAGQWEYVKPWGPVKPTPPPEKPDPEKPVVLAMGAPRTSNVDVSTTTMDDALLDPRLLDDSPPHPLSTDDTRFLEKAATILDADNGNGNSEPSQPPVALGVLPPNLFSGFGGLDASCAFGSLESFKANVFDLSISNPLKISTFTCTGSDSKTAQYTVPSYLNLTWGTVSEYFSATGTSKVDFIHDLSDTMDLGFDFFGFGAEFKRTFDEHTKEETFQKYMAQYDQEIVYKVGLKNKDEVKEHLSPDFKKALATWTAEKIVDQFGTHFMTEACFGGLRIYSSTLDELNNVTKHDLVDAIELKAPIIDPDTGKKVGNVSAKPNSEDHVVNSILQTMDVLKTKTIGGTAPDGEALFDWRQSLASNPSVVKYKVKSLDTLVDDPTKKSALQTAIKARLAMTEPVDGCNVLAIRVPLKPYYSDRDSRGKHDISVAYPDIPKGWYAVGQFAQPAALENAFYGKSYCIAVRGNPNFDLDPDRACPALFGATSAKRRWYTERQGNNYGMFTPVFDSSYQDDLLKKYPALKTSPQVPLIDQYQALGDIFEPAVDPQSIPRTSLENIACFHTSCLKELPKFPPKVWIWDDTNTHGTPDVTVMGAPNLEMPDGKSKERRQMVIQAPETGPSYIFKCLPRGDDGSTEKWYTLDWDKVKWMENKWMADIPH
ncbi:uncharacterized protein A1O5_05526 [Cladophialophora psammophila CBS 110553]|uniref:MACPF domain-containing protein n=1 Tax=Cladophialophora psammophila CBS 110553 TaxID=1182543 RepID=W9WUS2_9EURO|nr:uncharacterized protein A1O5_05526 [Cladophialophora psammophila CBS 110553]EXJ71718.1 hypothetical protein A1O5_05526 [Cladophialophora psammophila CBS 110553]